MVGEKSQSKRVIMQKKIISTLICVVLIALCALTLFACNAEQSEFVMPKGTRPGYASLFDGEDIAIIQKVVDGTATEDEIKRAVMALYDTANKSRKETPVSLVVQESDAGLNVLGDEGKVLMHAFNLRDGDRWYYQLATQVSTSNSFFSGLMQMFAGFLKVAYSDGNGNYYYFNEAGEAYNCDCTPTTFPYAKFTIPEDESFFDKPMKLEEFNKELNVLDEIHEINNMAFCEEIIADGAKVEWLEEDGQHYYRVSFSVDVDADKELVNKWFAMAKKDMAAGGQTLKSYEYYNAVLEVWDNGYAKSYESYSSREAESAFASGKPVDRFSYIWNTDEIIALVLEDEAFAELDEDVVFESIGACLDYYTDKDNITLVKRQLSMLAITGIVIGCIAFVIIAIIVTVEVLVKTGKLPKEAARREARKQKRIAKKNAKKGICAESNETENLNFEQRFDTTEINEECDDGYIVTECDDSVTIEGDFVATKPEEPIDEAFAVACDENGAEEE